MTPGSALDFTREAPADCARRLGISREAAELFLASDAIDLHIDSFIWQRLIGYDIGRRHGGGLFGGRFYSQVDLPRLRQLDVAGATWVITTNPLRSRRGRQRAFTANLQRLQQTLGRFESHVALVRTVEEYRNARAAGKHAAFIGIQGGNCLDAELAALDALDPQQVLRVTLVHLSSSRLGATSSPAAIGDKGLSDFGRQYVELLNTKQVFVDLAHIHSRGFYDALEASDRSQPPVVTHTGVSAVHPHWRNLDDEQIRAIADRGGVVGVLFHSPFLGGGWFGGSAELVVDHIQHIVQLVGDDVACIGSDFDGAIVPPPDLRSCLELPRLVDCMLRRGFNHEQVQKVLGGNFLRVLGALRG